MSETGIKDLILNEKPSDTIVLLKEKGPSYPKKLSEETETTYSHMVRMLKSLKDEGLVTSEKKGRRKVYQLSDKGDKLGSQLSDLYGTDLIKSELKSGDEEEDQERPDIENSIKEKYN